MERISKNLAEVATELMKPLTSLEKQVSKSRLELLKTALAKFGLLRGEVMDATRLESYSKALAEAFEDDRDTLTVLGAMAKARRAEYEPKIPDLGDLLERIRDVERDRQREKREAKEREDREAEERHRREHPEEYVSWAEIMREYRDGRNKETA